MDEFLESGEETREIDRKESCLTVQTIENYGEKFSFF